MNRIFDLSSRECDRIEVFVDLRNIIRGASGYSDISRIDFYGLLKHVIGRRRMVAVYAYDGLILENGVDIQKGFHDYLSHMGMRLDLRECNPNGIQKATDVAIASRMVADASNDHYDVAVLISGDGDFVPAVEMVQDHGKRVEVAALSHCLSSELSRKADVVMDLDPVPMLSMRSLDTEVEA